MHRCVPRGSDRHKKVKQYLPFRPQKIFWLCGQILSAKKCSKLLKSFRTVKIFSWHFESAHPLLIRNLDFQRLSARFHWADGSKLVPSDVGPACSIYPIPTLAKANGICSAGRTSLDFPPKTVTYIEKSCLGNLRPLEPSFVNTFRKIPCWRRPKAGEHSPPCSDWKPW